MFSKRYIQELKAVLDSFPHEQFEKIHSAMMKAYQEKKNIFVMGNGGSASTASHWVCDVNKGCSYEEINKFKMMCLNDSIPTILAYANDVSYDDIFVEQLKNYFDPGDVVIGISGSGNSENVLRAIDYANDNNGITIGLCGFSGGKLYRMVKIPMLAQINDIQKVEDVHLMIVHMTLQRIRQELDVLKETQKELIPKLYTAL